MDIGIDRGWHKNHGQCMVDYAQLQGEKDKR